MATIDESLDRTKPFPRPTERLQRAERHAQELADGMYHSFIGTRHLLIAILLQDGGPARAALDAIGLDAPALAQKLLNYECDW